MALACDAAPIELGWAARHYRDALAKHFRHLVPADASVLEVGCGAGDLLVLLPNADITGVDIATKPLARARERLPRGVFLQQAGEKLSLNRTFDVIILSDTLNLAADVQQLLWKLHSVAHERTRLVINFQNHLWRPMLSFAGWFGWHRRPATNNWLSSADLSNLTNLADWEIVQRGSGILCPVPLLGVDRLLNSVIRPFVPGLALAIFLVARPRRPIHPPPRKTVSVVIPARNEAGNIEAAVQRTPEMGAWTEIIFVEGHSRDDTWARIEALPARFPARRIKILRQTGRGKGNAVRDGFAVAEGDILMILDADLTMPPEELPKFYEAVASNRAEFANGSRLVYPMEKHAMQFLNMCANKTFGLIFTWLLGQSVKDTLCGTKVLRNEDYKKIVANRTYFGDFDPFGDFDLLFGASKLSLKIADVPIRYRERTYGTTNIQRWKHGWLLLRMVMFAARKLKFF
ncbi:MAG: glycosyltransferase [Opitutaceae bacterium]|nr:glycosyltransferase [Verrucomicrobiales bacterium]